jgi:cyclic beta-1,2-glucan synthetase
MPWLSPIVPTRKGWARNVLPLFARWKILDNLRRSLLPPAIVTLFLSGWTYLPGNPNVWTVATSAGLTCAAFLWLAEAVAGPQPWQPWRVLFRNLLDDTKTALARALLQLVFLAYHAGEMIHAIIVTLVRLIVTHRRMLEWQTAATSRRLTDAAAQGGTRSFVEQMAPGVLLAIAALAATAVVRPRCCPGLADSPVVDGCAVAGMRVQPAAGVDSKTSRRTIVACSA